MWIYRRILVQSLGTCVHTFPLRPATMRKLASAPLPSQRAASDQQLPWQWGLASALLPSTRTGTLASATVPAKNGPIASAKKKRRQFSGDPEHYSVRPSHAVTESASSADPTYTEAQQNLSAQATALINAAWEPSTIQNYERVLKVHVYGTSKFATDGYCHQTHDALHADGRHELVDRQDQQIGDQSAAHRAQFVQRVRRRVGRSCENVLGGFEEKLHSHPVRKTLLSVAELKEFCQTRLALGTAAGARDAAMAIFCFLAIERVSEAIALLASNIHFQKNAWRFGYRSRKRPRERPMVLYTSGTFPNFRLLSYYDFRKMEFGPGGVAVHSLHAFCTTTSTPKA